MWGDSLLHGLRPTTKQNPHTGAENDKNVTMKKKLLLMVLIALGCRTTADAQMLSVNTDAVADLMMAPSLGFELVTSNRSTVGVNVLGAYKPWGKDIRLIGVQPEYRYYFSGRPMHHEFVGIGGVGASYDITWKGKVYDGMALGMGLTFGYVFNITKRLNVDCHAGFGAIMYRHKEYFENDKYDADYSIGGVERTNAKGYVLLPTRIGVSLTYILK